MSMEVRLVGFSKITPTGWLAGISLKEMARVLALMALTPIAMVAALVMSLSMTCPRSIKPVPTAIEGSLLFS